MITFQTVSGTVFALIVILLAGSGVLRLLARGAAVGPAPERAGLAWLLGAGYVSLALFVFGWVLRDTALLVAVTLGGSGLYLAGRRCPAPPRDPRRPLSGAEWCIVAVLGLQACILLWSAANLVLGWDALCTWDTKARIAFAHGGVLPAEYFQDPTRDWSHHRYPLGWANLQTWHYLCMGVPDQAWVRGLGTLYYVATAGLIAGAVERLGGTRFVGGLMAAALFFLPMITARPYGHFAGYADLPMAALYLAAATRLPGWTSERSLADDRLLAALGALLVWTKSEGMILFAGLLAVALLGHLRAGTWRRIFLLALPGVCVMAAFAIYLRTVNTLPDMNYLPVTFENWSAKADRYAPIALHMGNEVFQWRLWSLLWPGTLLALACLAAQGAARHAILAGLILLLPWPAFTLAWVLSAWPDYMRHVTTSLSRLYLEFAPFALFVIGLAIAKTWSSEIDANRSLPEPSGSTASHR